jgi:hypothetical protein
MRVIGSLLPAVIPVISARVEDDEITGTGQGIRDPLLPLLGLPHLDASGQEDVPLKSWPRRRSDFSPGSILSC